LEVDETMRKERYRLVYDLLLCQLLLGRGGKTYSISCEYPIPSRCIKRVEDEYKCNDGWASGFDVLGHIERGTNCPWEEAEDEHAGQACEEHGPPAEFVNYVGAPEGPGHVPEVVSRS
jgi:hypothetical protein